MQGLPLFPLYLFDFFGASATILLSLVAFRSARRLTRLEPKSVLWTYLFWFTVALLALALSRGIGHVLRFLFILSGHGSLWTEIAPLSGGLNTLAFTTVAVLTLSYYSAHGIIEQVRQDAESLAEANRRLQGTQEDLRRLNQTLEQRVEERTRELRSSEQKFRRLFEGSKDMIFFCDAGSRILDINASGVELLGFSRREEVVGKPLAGFFLDEEKWARYACRLGSEGQVADLEAELRREDGTPLHLLIAASALRDARGEIQGSEGIAKDLTHFKRVNKQLMQSEKMASVGQLAAGVAHEINTPLGVILGYAQLLKEDFAAQAEVREPLEIIEQQTKICKRIVSDLLKFSRQSPEGRKTVVDLNHLVGEVLSIVEHTLNMDRITVERELAPDLPPVLADADRLRQVLVNIINNAHHAIGREGLVAVWTRYDAHCQEIELMVGDTGSGIAPEIIGRIFDPFFTTKSVDQGTGLGLSVSFGIIHDLGGQIEAFSPPRDPRLLQAGMRTAFHIRLPLERSTEGGGPFLQVG